MTESTWYQAIGSKVWYFFNSLTLTIFLLMTLAGASIFGTVIEQNKSAAEYLDAYGAFWTQVIVYTRLYDMYHSLWFSVMLAALGLNIIVCTFERFPPKWRTVLRQKPEKFDPKLIENCSHNERVALPGTLEEAGDRVMKALRRKRFKVAEVQAASGLSYYAWKGTSGRFGSDIVHISLLLILLGAIVGGTWGYKGFKIVPIGDVIKAPDAGFTVRLDKFWIDYYDTGQIKQYNSLLTVLEGDKEVLAKQIWVNEPLHYKGVRFYQSSYGTMWDRVEYANIAVVEAGTGKVLNNLKVDWEGTEGIPGTDYTIRLAGFTSDFAYDEETKQVFSKTPEAENPAINVEIRKGGKVIATPWLFMKYPGIFPAIPGSGHDLVFSTYRPVPYSGIQLNKDPGTNIVWLGTAVMGIGFFFAFFVYHRRVWVHVRETGKSTEVRIGGIINKNNFVLEKEIKELAEEVRGRTEGVKS